MTLPVSVARVTSSTSTADRGVARPQGSFEGSHPCGSTCGERVLAAFSALADRLDAPAPVTPAGILRLRALLTTAPANVAVGDPDAVLADVRAISYALENG